MTLQEAKTVKKGDHLLYETEDNCGKKVYIECIVKSIWGDPTKFGCDVVDSNNEAELTNCFSPISCFSKI